MMIDLRQIKGGLELKQLVRFTGTGNLYYNVKNSKIIDRRKMMMLYEEVVDPKTKEIDEEFRNTDLTRFTYTQKDIDKMKQYYNKRSNPERLVASIKDDNKLVARWISAIIIELGQFCP